MHGMAGGCLPGHRDGGFPHVSALCKAMGPPHGALCRFSSGFAIENGRCTISCELSSDVY